MKFLNPSSALFSGAFLVLFAFHFSYHSQAQCYTTVDWELTPLPSNDNPDFNVTDTVELCVEVYEVFSSDWLHGVSISLPIGWELISADTEVDCGNGEWIFIENPTLPMLGPGYYYDSNSGGSQDGNPFNNFGSPDCSAITVCFQVRMVELFADELNTSNVNSAFAITVVGDSWIIPGWSGPTCDYDEVTHYWDINIPPVFNGQELTGAFELSSGSCAPSSVEIQLLESGTEVVAETHTVSVNADGTFASFIDSYGQFDIRLKGSKVLAEKVLAVNLDGGTTTLGTISIIPGDVNGDNFINLVDVSVLSGGYGLEVGDAFFDASIDFNCDGYITLVDISLLSAGFGMAGE